MVVQANRDEPLVPTFSIALNPPGNTPNDQAVAQDLLQWITSVSVQDRVNDPSTFELQLIDQDAMDGGISWADDERFVIGANVAVSLGYGSKLEMLITGEITGLEPEFSVNGLPTLRVHGADRRYKLQAARGTRPLLMSRTLTGVVKEICEAKHLQIDGPESTAEADRSMVQWVTSDLDFVKYCAELLHYELVMEGRQLHFQPIDTRAPRVATLTLDDDLLAFSPAVDLQPHTQIQMLGYDAQTKTEMSTSASDDTAAAGMGGTQTGAQITRRVLGGESIEVVSGVTVGSQAELTRRARAKYDAAALKFVTGSGRCRGRTDIRAGKIIGIGGVGTRFSGDYRIESAGHAYQRGGDYVTTFQVERNAL
jgi:phage protein D